MYPLYQMYRKHFLNNFCSIRKVSHAVIADYIQGGSFIFL